jgi:hypothetical protein
MILDTTFDPSSVADENTLPQTGFDAGGNADGLASTSSASVAKIHKHTYRFMRSPTYKAQGTTQYSVSLKFHGFSFFDVETRNQAILVHQQILYHKNLLS